MNKEEGRDWVEGKDEGERKGNGARWNEEGRGRMGRGEGGGRTRNEEKGTRIEGEERRESRW